MLYFEFTLHSQKSWHLHFLKNLNIWWLHGFGLVSSPFLEVLASTTPTNIELQKKPMPVLSTKYSEMSNDESTNRISRWYFGGIAATCNILGLFPELNLTILRPLFYITRFCLYHSSFRPVKSPIANPARRNVIGNTVDKEFN